MSGSRRDPPSDCCGQCRLVSDASACRHGGPARAWPVLRFEIGTSPATAE
jgi:hypothetical protein